MNLANKKYRSFKQFNASISAERPISIIEKTA